MSLIIQQVYLPAIEGYVPDGMVKALHAFLEFCYIAWCNVHDIQSWIKPSNTTTTITKYL